MPAPLKDRIAAALAAFAPANSDLFAAGIGLFDALGYDTSRQARMADNSAPGFVADYVTAADTFFSPERARTAEWRRVELLFQLTQAEVINQVSLFDTRQVDRSRIEAYLFWAIELTGDGYTRTELAQMTRELNRLFLMPCFVLFRYGDCLTLATIDRRLSKRDERRDVLEKITLVKDIALASPHPGHVAILHDLSFGELYQRHRFDSFVALHRAWLDTLNIALLNRRFYRELYTWYEWAAQPESGVQFPRPAADVAQPNALSDDAYRRLSLIRLLTRVIFVWFLREKKLVPTDLFQAANLKKHLKTFNPNDEASSSFYQGILQNLFFATLNTPMRRDVEARRQKGEDVDDEVRRFALDERNSPDHTDKTKYRGQELFLDPAAALGLFADVPFLNGGLFECLDEADGQRYDGFSTKPKKRATVPNVLFFGQKSGLDQTLAYGGDKKQRQVTAHGLLVILERYKFTVAENTPLEEEVALDPELLGKVFENLLATYNPETQTTARKLTGSFYTPREIVDYMVDESLRAYLAQALPAPAGTPAAQRLAQLFGPEDPAAPDPNPFGADTPDTLALIGALSRCRVLDPACGSGAFPMGVLHRMVALLRRLDPDNRHFQAEQLRLADADIARAEAIAAAEVREPAVRNAEQRRATVLASFAKDAEAAQAERATARRPLADGLRRQNYARKLFLIENCIYGVDIQQIAVQIAKLRFFISLLAEQRVADHEENRNILAMPNLETKFVAANTLVPLDRSNTLGTQHPLVVQREQELQQLRQQLFFVRKYPEKKRLRQREQAKRLQLSEALETAGFSRTAADQVAAWSPLDVMHPAGFFDAETMFGLNDGFDVVIGNPPYVNAANIRPESYRRMLADTYYSAKNKADLYAYFIEKGLSLLSGNSVQSGVLSYIVPHTWKATSSFKNLREIIFKQNSLLKVVNLEMGVFDAVVKPMIVLLTKGVTQQKSILVLDENFVEIDTILVKEVVNHPELAFDTTSSRVEKKLFELIEIGTQPVEKFIEFSRGIKTSDDGRFISERVIDANSKKLFRGRNIKSFMMQWEGEYIWYKPELMKEKVGSVTYSKEFFEVPEKIVTQRVNSTSQLLATYDDSQNYFLDTVNVSRYQSKKPGCPSLKFLCGLINSKVINFWYANKYQMPTIGIYELHSVPIKVPSESEQLPFIRLVEYILWLKAQNPADSRAQYFERVLDGLVYELYFAQAVEAGGCAVGRHLPPLPPLPAAEAAAEAQLQALYAALEDKNHPVRKALFFMDTVEEVAIIEGKRK